MSKKLPAAFLLILIGFTVGGTASAQLYTIPGVAEGNTFTYDVMVFWSSSDQDAIIPANLLEINMTKKYEITITNFIAPTVEVKITRTFENGTEINTVGAVNLDVGFYTGGFWAIYGSNLTANTLLHPAGSDGILINGTVARDYAGVQRETNYVMLTEQHITPAIYTQHSSIYFDKQTGMLVELNDESVYVSPSATVSIVWKIRESNVWVVPEFPSLLVLPLFVIATLIAVIIYKKKSAKANDCPVL